MKITSFGFVALLILIGSCRNPANSLKQGETFNRLYDFAETTDPGWCHPDSIIPTDCGGGSLYFTKNGNVICNFYCLGSDTTIYNIGKYQVGEQGIDCVFSQSYSFYNGESYEEMETESDPNNGSLENSEIWTLRLKKTNCPLFEFSTVMDDLNYVFYKPDEDNAEFFFLEYHKIKRFSKL